ncbi:MAG: histidine kinase [Candidatus Angelobacter sp.]
MGSRSLREAVKSKGTKNGHTHFLRTAPAPGEAQRRLGQLRNGFPQTVTELGQAIAAKIESHQQLLKSAVLQTIWEHHPVSVIVCDAGGKIIMAKAVAKQMARMEPEGMLLSSAPSIWGMLLPSTSGRGPTGWPPLSALLARPMELRECRLVKSCNTAYDVMFSSSPLTTGSQTKAGAVLMLTDITSVKRREAILRERMVSEERSRMAAELHDTLCQGLNAVVLLLQAAEISAAGDNKTLQRQVNRAHEVARDTLREARRSMWTFSRQAMGNIDPAASLALAAEEIFNGTSVQCELSLQEQPFDLPSRIRFELLRIGKEALTNVQKHSQATRVQMQLTYRKQLLQLSVTDDGCGFVPGSTADVQHGYGLTSMRQRAEGLGGKIIIESQPRHGTRVMAIIPLSREANATAMAA